LQKVIISLNSYNNLDNNLHCLENIYEILNYNFSNKSRIKEIENITTKLYETIEKGALFIEIMQQLIKKFVKNQDILHKISNDKFIDNQIFTNKLAETPEKFILWLIS
jgi:hypothetical protein